MLLVFEDAELRQRELRQRVCERLDLNLVLIWNGELEKPVGKLGDVLDADVQRIAFCHATWFKVPLEMTKSGLGAEQLRGVILYPPRLPE